MNLPRSGWGHRAPFAEIPGAAPLSLQTPSKITGAVKGEVPPVALRENSARKTHGARARSGPGRPRVFPFLGNPCGPRAPDEASGTRYHSVKPVMGVGSPVCTETLLRRIPPSRGIPPLSDHGTGRRGTRLCGQRPNGAPVARASGLPPGTKLTVGGQLAPPLPRGQVVVMTVRVPARQFASAFMFVSYACGSL